MSKRSKMDLWAWRLFKATLCVIPSGFILCGALAVTGFAAAATIFGWIAVIALVIVTCLVIWFGLEDKELYL